MKQVLIKIIVFIKKVFLFILNIFFNFDSKKNLTNKSQSLNQKNPNNEENLIIKVDDNDSDNSSRELFKEFLNQNNEQLFDKETIEKEFYKFVEKTFKIKVRELPYEKKQKLEDYTTKKLVINVEKKIIESQMNQKVELEKLLKEQLKRDIEKKGYNFEQLVEKPSLYQQAKENKFFISELKEDKKNKINPINLKMNNSVKHFDEKKVIASVALTQDEYLFKEIKKNQLELLAPLVLSKKILENKTDEEVRNETTNENTEELRESFTETENLTISPESTYTSLEKTISPVISSNEQLTKNKEELIKNNKEETKTAKIEEKNKRDKEDEEEKTKEPTKTISIDIVTLEIEDNKLIANAKKEYQKEDLVDKEYEKLENILEERIAKLKSLLLNPLSNDQKQKITNELDKLKNVQEQVKLHKKNDIENLRLSLEEIIPLEEKELINQKFKEFILDEELKKNELLFQNIENKSKQELEKLEQIMIKESFKKTLRRLETPLFLSFPFIKNKYFRKFVGGLFIFRSFGFIKNLLFGVKNPYTDIDLTSIQKGSDALNESISITETNIASFENLKKVTLIKYPQLKEDIDFMNDLNKIEENLYKNYERLLKQDKVVKKYFTKSKDLIRKRKKRFF